MRHDLLEQELNKGDFIVTQTNYGSLVMAVIVGFTPKGIKVVKPRENERYSSRSYTRIYNNNLMKFELPGTDMAIKLLKSRKLIMEHFK